MIQAKVSWLAWDCAQGSESVWFCQGANPGCCGVPCDKTCPCLVCDCGYSYDSRGCSCGGISKFDGTLHIARRRANLIERTCQVEGVCLRFRVVAWNIAKISRDEGLMPYFYPGPKTNSLMQEINTYKMSMHEMCIIALEEQTP